MSVEVVLPALGESVTEGTVTQWLKQVGDDVAVDEPLLEVSTDKVDTEIPSPAAGVLLEI
jgi:pyruvate/2-oxoglutarate dehydrogenase complex dihydrolipoamide acyltransferase (E2) component